MRIKIQQNMETKKLSIEEYLEQDEKKDLLRLLTAGSVDDGKSTLIGRLLYDSKRIYDDQLQSLERDSRRIGKAGDHIDYSLLLDGLKAEREQGITIDVAYRYFSTNKRKFIIADTPGHEQYTRNMITGGSTANLAIILVDARNGILTQTHRHTYLVSLLGIKHIVLAVNKMDLVDFSKERYDSITSEYLKFAGSLGLDDILCIPLSALDGDNVVEKSSRTPWYELRPDLDFRGFSGKIASGVIHRGDTVMALPSGKTSRISRIVTYDGDLEYAFAPQCVTVTLEDEIDLSRGEMLVKPEDRPFSGHHFKAMTVWMDETRMDRNKAFFLKQTTNTTRAHIGEIDFRVDVNTLEQMHSDGLALNEVGLVHISTSSVLMYDSYRDNKATGAFIIIDPVSNFTSGVGMIIGPDDEAAGSGSGSLVIDMAALGIEAGHYDAIEKACAYMRSKGIDVKCKK